MSHALPIVDSAQATYRCPGEAHSISHAVHLGRLAAFYPACRTCTHRHSTSGLPTMQRSQLAELEQRGAAKASFHGEGIAGVAGNQLGPAEVRQAALAMGICLRQHIGKLHLAGGSSPHVLLAGDARPLTAELLSAGSEGLRRAGCTVIELDAATCGSMSDVLSQSPGASGLLIGNPGSEPHIAGLKVWGPEGLPWSMGNSLDMLAAQFSAGSPRPVRHYGGVDRSCAGATYIARRRELFHALRPVRMVLSTVSAPLTRQLTQLLGTSACQVETVRSEHFHAPAATARHPAPIAKPRSTSLFDWNAAHERRLAQLGRQVCQDRAHLGIWIDGDGDCLQLFDEQGRAVSSQRLFVSLTRASLAMQSSGTIVLEPSSDVMTADALRQMGAVVVASSGTREGMALAMREHAALLGGGTSGRIWWSARLAGQVTGDEMAATSGPPISDVLLTLGVLLQLLSQSDRPLSQVLDSV